MTKNSLETEASVLASSGLTPNEAAVYLVLLGRRQATAAELATTSRLKRPLVYLTLERLLTKGLVSKLPNTRVRRFTAADPLHLYRSIQATTEQLKFMLPVLRSLYHSHSTKPAFEFHEDPEAIATVYRSLESSPESRYVSSYAQLTKYFPEEVKRWARRGHHTQDKNRSKHLIEDEPVGHAFAKPFAASSKQRFHLLPQDIHPGVDLSLAHDLFVITNFEPLFLISIQSAALVQTLTAIFDLAWREADEVPGGFLAKDRSYQLE